MHSAVAMTTASPARRLGGYVLDVLYSMVAMLLLSALVPTDNDAAGGFVVMLWFAYLIVGVYFWSKGTSPGKMTLGMYVYDQRTGNRLGFWPMLLREVVGKWISGLIFGLGYLWILLDKDHQGWHDKLVNSVVLEG